MEWCVRLKIAKTDWVLMCLRRLMEPRHTGTDSLTQLNSHCCFIRLSACPSLFVELLVSYLRMLSHLTCLVWTFPGQEANPWSDIKRWSQSVLNWSEVRFVSNVKTVFWILDQIQKVKPGFHHNREPVTMNAERWLERKWARRSIASLKEVYVEILSLQAYL